MSGDRAAVVVRAFSWRDLCPWLVIFRAFRLSIRLPLLFLATCGVLLNPVGWRLGERMFVNEATRANDPEFVVLTSHLGAWPRWTADAIESPSDLPRPTAGPVSPGSSPASSTWAPRQAPDVYQQFFRPYRYFFLARRLTIGQAAYLTFGALWTLLVWGYLGGMLSRIAVMRLGREENVGLVRTCRFVLGRLRSYMLAPLFPLAGVALLVAPCAALGLLMRVDAGVWLAAIVWPIVLVAGLAITVLATGLMFGWPLMWGAISAEPAGDEFEALHRSYSYTFQRPLHYLFYAVVALAFGAFCWLLVDRFADAVIYFTRWATAWGVPADRWTAIETTAAGSLIGFWFGLVRTVAAGFAYSFFWCVAAAVYLLLRSDTDQTEFDEVYVEDEDDARHLPELKTDAAGVQTLSEPAPPPTPGSEASQG